MPRARPSSASGTLRRQKPAPGVPRTDEGGVRPPAASRAPYRRAPERCRPSCSRRPARPSAGPRRRPAPRHRARSPRPRRARPPDRRRARTSSASGRWPRPTEPPRQPSRHHPARRDAPEPHPPPTIRGRHQGRRVRADGITGSPPSVGRSSPPPPAPAGEADGRIAANDRRWPSRRSRPVGRAGRGAGTHGSAVAARPGAAAPAGGSGPRDAVRSSTEIVDLAGRRTRLGPRAPDGTVRPGRTGGRARPALRAGRPPEPNPPRVGASRTALPPEPRARRWPPGVRGRELRGLRDGRGGGAGPGCGRRRRPRPRPGARPARGPPRRP